MTMLTRPMIYSEVPYLLFFNEHFPIQIKNISSGGKSKPWITPGILAAIRRKGRLEKKARQNPNDS